MTVVRWVLLRKRLCIRKEW